MAAEANAGSIPFDMTELKYVACCLGGDEIDPETVLRNTRVADSDEYWSAITTLVGNTQTHYVTITPDRGMGKLTTADLWTRSKSQEAVIIKGFIPNFIFLTLPDFTPTTSLRTAYRRIISTLICHISSYVTHVPPDKMREAGVEGGQFARKYLGTDGDIGSGNPANDSIAALLQLLSALQHCDFATSFKTEIEGKTVEFPYVYVIVIDRMGRLWEEDDHLYWELFKGALEDTVQVKMGGAVVFVEEHGGNIDPPVHHRVRALRTSSPYA
ncbi:hypothetical protein NUW58_g1861 [Xylaria curta]|uniref:Uncharacterized protein n=1 Tax=Xylaria curta TaxID=42375 RepID=A0ACC1PLJ8_9PEZI|nr:hypothetical protein NUW58_g1861 [Xylaria curta]